MGKRRIAREMAIQMLYQADLGRSSPEAIQSAFGIEDFFREGHSEDPPPHGTGEVADLLVGSLEGNDPPREQLQKLEETPVLAWHVDLARSLASRTEVPSDSMAGNEPRKLADLLRAGGRSSGKGSVVCVALPFSRLTAARRRRTALRNWGSMLEEEKERVRAWGSDWLGVELKDLGELQELSDRWAQGGTEVTGFLLLVTTPLGTAPGSGLVLELAPLELEDRLGVKTLMAASLDACEAFLHASALASGVSANDSSIDELIRSQAENWRLERMPAVDRNILRLAVYEMLHETDVPKLVVVDEAVELAKRFGSEQSGKFVNGLLDGLLRHHAFPGSLK